MKKTVMVLSLIFLMIVVSGAVFASENVRIFVDGREIVSDVPAQIINGRAMVPARFVSEALGSKVQWDPVSNSVIIKTNKSPSTADSKGISYDLIKLNGEQTTWPYWLDNGNLYMEYRNALELIRFCHPHPNFSIVFYKGLSEMAVGNGSFAVPTLQKDGFTLISITFLKEKRNLLNYEWDPETGNMKIIPLQ